MSFTLRFTDTNKETGGLISVYETTEHGWGCLEDFLASLSKYNGRVTHTLLPNGYLYQRENVSVITKVEAIQACAGQ